MPSPFHAVIFFVLFGNVRTQEMVERLGELKLEIYDVKN